MPARDRAAARDAGRPTPPSGDEELAARDQVRRLPHDGACRGRRGAADHPRRARLDRSATATCRRRSRALPCKRGDHRRRDRGARRQGHQPLRAAAGRAVARAPATSCVFYAFDLLYLDGYDLTKAPLDRAQGAARATARRPRRPGARRSSSATMSRATGRRSTSRPRSWGSKASSRSAPTRPISAAARRPGSRPRRCIGDFVIAGYTTSRGGRGARRAGARRVGRRRAALSRQGRHRLRCARRCADLLDAAGAAARPGAAQLDGAPKDIIWVRPVLSAHIHYSNLTARQCAAPRRVQGPARGRAHAPTAPAPAQAADLRRRPRHDLGDQPDAAAVRQVRADQARHRGLLRARSATSCCRTSSAGRCRWCAARPAGRRTASSSATPSPACRRRSRPSRPRTREGEDEDLPLGRGRQGLSGAGAVRRGRVPRLGHAARSSSEKPDRVIFDLDPGEGIAWREVVEAAVHVRGELEALGLVPFVKTSGGKGLHVVVPIKPKLDWKEVHAATGEIAARLAATAPDTFTTDDGQGQPQAADLHRFPPQCAQRHGGRALFAAGAHQPAGIDAARLGRSRVHRRSGGFELFFASGSVDDVRRSLGGH